MESKKQTSVGVIGAGVCGIVSIKECLQAGLNVTCFERSSYYGGLWNYHDEIDKEASDGQHFTPSVMKTTILNTSKELSAFSDFPPPPHLPNFMKHNLYMDYIRSYAEHFKVVPQIKLEHEILNCQPEYNDQDGTVKWSVSALNKKTNEKATYTFDRLIIAIGHHNVPFMPTFANQHKFKGQIIHSMNIKNIIHDDRFINKKVVIVGFGNSACDAANDLAMVTTNCYLSTHRGNWIVSRLSPQGVYEFELKNRWKHLWSKVLPTSIFDRLVISKLGSRLNHELLGLTPKHKPSEHVPSVNDLIGYRILTGGVVLKGSIVSFTEDGVVFEGEEDCNYQADIVVMATGYTAETKFLDEFGFGIKSRKLNEYELFSSMFAPKLNLPNSTQATSKTMIKSLAFIGMFQPLGSITVVSELQARYAALVFKDQLDLPSVENMIKEIEVSRKKRSRAIRSHSRDQIVGSWIDFCDELANKIGSQPNLFMLLFQDFTLWKKLMFGPSVSYQYRLRGPGQWAEARETIMKVDERVYAGINQGKNHILFRTRHKKLTNQDSKIKV